MRRLEDAWRHSNPNARMAALIDGHVPIRHVVHLGATASDGVVAGPDAAAPPQTPRGTELPVPERGALGADEGSRT